MAMRVCWWGIISLAVTKRAASSDLAAEAMTNLMIWAMESIVRVPACLDGVEPCTCKRKGHQFQRLSF